MEISRKTILDKTNYGINIYAYVLRQHYPSESVLSLSGRDCKPTKNPFNENKLTLYISIVDNCAIHTDTSNSIPNGDALDFAKLYFKKEGQELFQLINEVLHLHIGEVINFYKYAISTNKALGNDRTYPAPLVPRCSYFKHPVSNIFPDKTVSIVDIYHLIKGNAFVGSTNNLRAISDSREARKYKASNFDYATFSGIFSKRNDRALISHSGLLTLDFDHISILDSLKKSLLNDQYFETVLMFISPSGNGLKWIIQIDITKVKHQVYFKAVANYIKQTYMQEIDQSGKDISRACFIPHDATVYINPKYIQ